MLSAICHKLKWWARSQPIRTTAEIPAHIKILPAKPPYLYQKISKKANELYLLGMNYSQIAKALKVDFKVVQRAIVSNGAPKGCGNL
ncbi:MAG: hypothetical protein D4S01_01205 [Dehalococcoidia bacterium]|nr:MAG: hypothetical protein D4S01_01205 [Dehalococcoidia bacterium]